MTIPDPVYDAERLEEIVALGLLEPDVNPVLNDIAVRAAAALGQPVSLVSVVLDEALHVAAAAGVEGMWMVDVGGHPLEWSFCATSVRTRDTYVVEDAAEDPTHKDNPLVTMDGVRCYAGAPMISSRGFVLGNLCVVGMEARTFSEAEMATLRDLAAEAVQRLEARRQA